MADDTCPKPDCIDTPLVTASAIMGIMTFIYAVLVGMLVTYIQVMTLDSELGDMILSWESLERQLEACRAKLNAYNAVLPKGQVREELYHLYGLLKRCDDMTKDPAMKKMVKKVSEFNHFDRAKRLRSMIAGNAVKDSMGGRLNGAQRALSELQLGLIQLKQDVINADQIARSNALFDMLLDPAKRPNVDEIRRFRSQLEAVEGGIMRANLEKSSPTESIRDVPSKDMSTESEYPFDATSRSKFRTADEENGPYADLSRSQTTNWDTERTDPVNENERVDALGTLLRVRTMSTAQKAAGNEG